MAHPHVAGQIVPTAEKALLGAIIPEGAKQQPTQVILSQGCSDLN